MGFCIYDNFLLRYPYSLKLFLLKKLFIADYMEIANNYMKIKLSEFKIYLYFYAIYLNILSDLI